jgi:hypothetical protein
MDARNGQSEGGDTISVQDFSGIARVSVMQIQEKYNRDHQTAVKIGERMRRANKTNQTVHAKACQTIHFWGGKFLRKSLSAARKSKRRIHTSRSEKSKKGGHHTSHSTRKYSMIPAIANRVWWRSVPIPAPLVDARDNISVSTGASEAATVAPARPLKWGGVDDECADDVADAGKMHGRGECFK